MPTITLFTGSAGPSIATAAAASALASAAAGRRTLLLSVEPAHTLGTLLGATLGAAPTTIGPRCDVLAIDGLAELAELWERGRAHLPSGPVPVAGDELPLVPGLELGFALLRLQGLAPHYDAVMLDAGPHSPLLRALAAPDGLRWAVRLLFGLDRGPGRSAASLGRALLPTTLMPSDMLGNVQDARVRAEQLREFLIAPGATTTCYVLRPDRPALEEARIAIPALQLHGLAVPAIIAGPLLPAELDGGPLAAHAEQERELLEETRSIWPGRALEGFSMLEARGGSSALGQLGARLTRTTAAPARPPIAHEWNGTPALLIELPGLPKGALQLTLSGDELIVRVGGYRRHILLPEPLRGISAIKATREGEHLVVRKRA
jgi:anion-transporting  ArsA/GET3 family ATPase